MGIASNVLILNTLREKLADTLTESLLDTVIKNVSAVRGQKS